jgi:hypothetical protein
MCFFLSPIKIETQKKHSVIGIASQSNVVLMSIGERRNLIILLELLDVSDVTETVLKRKRKKKGKRLLRRSKIFSNYVTGNEMKLDWHNL